MCVNCKTAAAAASWIATVGRALSPGGIKEKERKKEKSCVCGACNTVAKGAF